MMIKHEISLPSVKDIMSRASHGNYNHSPDPIFFMCSIQGNKSTWVVCDLFPQLFCYTSPRAIIDISFFVWVYWVRKTRT